MSTQLPLFPDETQQLLGSRAARAQRQLHPEEAFEYYKEHLLEAVISKQDLYARYGFRKPKVQPEDWEVFAAILLNDKAKRGVGVDLEHFEVKSALRGASFEYQYHKESGESKLEEDMRVDHVFISYSHDYRYIEVRLVHAEDLAPTFESWRYDLKQNYGELDKQRFRKTITNAIVEGHGTVILRISGGRLKTAGYKL